MESDAITVGHIEVLVPWGHKEVLVEFGSSDSNLSIQHQQQKQQQTKKKVST